MTKAACMHTHTHTSFKTFAPFYVSPTGASLAKKPHNPVGWPADGSISDYFLSKFMNT